MAIRYGVKLGFVYLMSVSAMDSPLFVSRIRNENSPADIKPRPLAEMNSPTPLIQVLVMVVVKPWVLPSATSAEAISAAAAVFMPR